MVVSHPTELRESWVDGRPDLRRRSTVDAEPPEPGVVTRYEAPVHPDEQERQTIG